MNLKALVLDMENLFAVDATAVISTPASYANIKVSFSFPCLHLPSAMPLTSLFVILCFVLFFLDECWGHSDCGVHGRCIDVETTTHPMKQCFCEPGWFGKKCSKGEIQISFYTYSVMKS